MRGGVVWSGALPWLPEPHHATLTASRDLPADETVSTAFAFVFDPCGRLLLTHVDRPGRGWDLPGGHLEPGEDPRTAAARELHEETGLLLPATALTPAGWLRIDRRGERPAGDRYPHPVSHMTYFVAHGADASPRTQPVAGSECSAAEWLSAPAVQGRCSRRTWLPLFHALVPHAA
ncbi:MAG TPA: NUDIX hydrolase [Streptosporangiales bacterium]